MGGRRLARRSRSSEDEEPLPVFEQSASHALLCPALPRLQEPSTSSQRHVTGVTRLRVECRVDGREFHVVKRLRDSVHGLLI